VTSRSRAGRRALAGAVLALALAAAPGASAQTLQPPPGGGIYHAAYPEFRGSEDHVQTRFIHHFENLVRKQITWAYFSDNWFKGIRFPQANVDKVRAAGAVPFIRLMARSGFRENRADRVYTLQRIINGEFDAQLTAWGQAAAAQPFPLLVEFGTEANGQWFPWNGKWAGGGATAAYGDPTLPDGPERFRDAYRHIHDVIAAAGADNITWFWHVTATSYPIKAWNSIASYYPGDAYVDWIGVSNYGPIFAEERFGPTFAKIMDRAYPQLAALSPDNPIAVLEYAVRQDKAKARWTRQAINSVASGRWPRIKALSYWHERFRNGDGTVSNLHVDSDKKTLRGYRRAIANPVFTTDPLFAGP
jgi:hypothetical protein